MNIKLLTLLISFLILQKSFGQDSSLLNKELLSKKWDANWICHPEHNENKQGVYLFRKQIELHEKPDNFIINISADNRYKLFVNGEMVCFGPARGTTIKWYFETIDISLFLESGNNVISAVVWNYGWQSPISQISNKTGLIIQGNTSKEQIINTNKSWKVHVDTSHSIFSIKGIFAYMAGPGEKKDCNKYPWGWRELNYNTKDWYSAKEREKGTPVHGMGYENMPNYILYPREIPLMQYENQKFKSIRQVDGIKSADEIIKSTELIIPENSNVKIILDQNELTNAYPFLKFSNGKGSKIKITYAESLFVPRITSEYSSTKNQEKGNRNIIKDKVFIGNYDIIIPDGGKNRIFEPNWWRVFRYIQLEIKTNSSPLTIHEFSSNYTAYPFVEKAKFISNNENLQKIWNTSWHTQELCSGETFFDCPYYEQIQYVGDTRIQGLISFYMTGDSLLWKKAIEDFYYSRTPIGLVQASAPTRGSFFIPTYSLFWIHMVHDYNLHCSDRNFIDKMIPTIIENINWFEERLDSDGLISNLEWWNFMDWVKHDSWNNGVPPIDIKGHSALINLLYAYTLNKASDLLKQYGYIQKSNDYNKASKSIKSYVFKTCWNDSINLLADNSEKKTYSQHVQALAVLSNAIPSDKQKEVLLNSYNNDSVIACTYYFKFYFFEALRKSGLGDLYIEMLEPWNKMLEFGLTTFAENPEPTRSDCHAWSASPVYHLLSIVSGIEPLENGFKKVKISPNFGDLSRIESTMPHKFGLIEINLIKSSNENINGTIYLPDGVDGEFHWRDKIINLKSGKNDIKI